MSARVIDGNAVAERVKRRVAEDVAELIRDRGRPPGLATVLVGDDEASHVYVSMKRKDCAAAGIASIHHELGSDVDPVELSRLLTELNEDPAVSGILLQLPLPAGLDADEMTGRIAPAKDVDGLTATNAGLLSQGRPGLVPCTPAGVVELLDSEQIELEGAEAVIVGRSALVGRPLGALLLARNATVTTCHSRTRDLAAVCGRADVLVAAVGVARMVTADMVKEGAVVIDVGINRVDGALVGDVDYDPVAERAGAITPVPGGVGPMTRAMLLSNTVAAARAQYAAGR